MLEGLSRALKEAIGTSGLQRYKIGFTCNLSHLLYVHDILIFGEGSKRKATELKEFLETLYCLKHAVKLGEIYHIYIGNP